MSEKKWPPLVVLFDRWVMSATIVIKLCRMSSSQDERWEITSPVGPPHISLVTDGAFDENLAAISLSVAR
jgi:hypothetical protein